MTTFYLGRYRSRSHLQRNTCYFVSCLKGRGLKLYCRNSFKGILPLLVFRSQLLGYYPINPFHSIPFFADSSSNLELIMIQIPYIIAYKFTFPTCFQHLVLTTFWGRMERYYYLTFTNENTEAHLSSLPKTDR